MLTGPNVNILGSGSVSENVIDLEAYREQKARSLPEHKKRRIAEIAAELLILQSEKNQLVRELERGES